MTFSTPSVENRVVSWRLLVHHAIGRYRLPRQTSLFDRIPASGPTR